MTRRGMDPNALFVALGQLAGTVLKGHCRRAIRSYEVPIGSRPDGPNDVELHLVLDKGLGRCAVYGVPHWLQSNGEARACQGAGQLGADGGACSIPSTDRACTALLTASCRFHLPRPCITDDALSTIPNRRSSIVDGPAGVRMKQVGVAKICLNSTNRAFGPPDGLAGGGSVAAA